MVINVIWQINFVEIIISPFTVTEAALSLIIFCNILLAFTCSELKIETLEQSLKYVQS